MSRRRTAQPELRPVYARPTFERRELAAKRAWCSAAYSGERYRPKAGEFDPLELRLGMRAQLVNARAGWVVSNPIYDSLLRSSPNIDPSLTGPGWLWEVYCWHKARGLVTLPRAGGVIEARLAALRGSKDIADVPAQPVVEDAPAQQGLFDLEEVDA